MKYITERYKAKLYFKDETEYQKFLSWLFNEPMPTPEQIQEIEKRVGSDYKKHKDYVEGDICAI